MRKITRDLANVLTPGHQLCGTGSAMDDAQDALLARVAAGLAGRSVEAFLAAVEDAAQLGPDGERLLAEHLPRVGKDRAAVIAAALGNAQGEAGPQALRAVLGVAGAGSRALRCAAVLALAKRCGPLATEDMLRLLAEASDSEVKYYACIALAGAGDERGYVQVLQWLRSLLRKPDRNSTLLPPAAVALAYLLRSTLNDAPRRTELVITVRARWNHLTPVEQDWVRTYWPGAHPGGADSAEIRWPDSASLVHWVRNPLFEGGARDV